MADYSFKWQEEIECIIIDNQIPLKVFKEIVKRIEKEGYPSDRYTEGCLAK